jgi:hypothetical protein
LRGVHIDIGGLLGNQGADTRAIELLNGIREGRWFALRADRQND